MKEGIYIIQNTCSEYNSYISGYFKTEEDALEALKQCSDWYRPNGTGIIYFKEFGLNGKSIEVYRKD